MTDSFPCQLRALDACDDVELRGMYDVMCEAEAVARPWLSPPPFAVCLDIYRRPTPDRELIVRAAFDEGRVVGVAIASLPHGSNSDSLRLNVFVAPDRQGVGIGARLVGSAEDVARDRGRSRIIGEGLTFPAASAGTRERLVRWCQGLGYRVVHEYAVHTLNLPVPETVIGALERDATVRAAGYDLRVVEDAVPDELLASYTDVYCAMNDEEPGGDVGDERYVTTSEDVAVEMAARAERGEKTLYALAIRDGRVVAHSDLRVFDGAEGAEQLNTLVAREHRGRRLGLAVKIAALRHLASTRPDVQRITTENNVVNTQMLAVNDALGYAPFAGELIVRKDLHRS